MSVDLLVISASSGKGSCDRMAFQVAKQMKEAGYSVQALLKEPVHNREIIHSYSKAKIPVGTTPHLRPSGQMASMSSALALSKRIKEMAPRAVNIHYPDSTISPADVRACRMGGAKNIVITSHQTKDPEAVPRALQSGTRAAAGNVDWVAVDSPALESTAIALGVPERKVLMIPLGVEGSDEAPDRKGARSSLRLPQDAFIVGTLSEITRDKRVDQIIQACANSPEFKKRGFLAIAGDGPERGRLEPLASKVLPSQHKFLGKLDDAIIFYQALDMFTMISDLGGYGMSFIEAAAWGVPSVGCDLGGTRFSILDGETGFLIPTNEPLQLGDRINFLMSDPVVTEHMSTLARKFAEKNFGMKKLVQTYERALGLRL